MARIFVVDDNDTMRDGMAVTLKKAGHDVLAFKNGVDAVAAFKTKRADLVVTDLKMEAMDGIEVVKQLKGADPQAVALVVTVGEIESNRIDPFREKCLESFSDRRRRTECCDDFCATK